MSDPGFFMLRDLLDDPALLALPECVVPRLAWAGRVTLLAAEEKTGKSTLVGQAVAALSRGADFLGESPRRRPTVWLALDEPLPDVVRRLARHGAREGVCIYLERPSPMDLEARIGEMGAGLVVVDTLTEFAAGLVEDLNDAAQWTGHLRELRRVAQSTDAAVILLHHTNRGSGKYRGSSQIGAGVDIIVEMTAGSSDPSARTCRSRGRLGVETYSLRYTDELGYEVDHGELPLDVRVYRAIEANPGLGTRKLRSIAGGRGAAVDAILDNLLRTGAVVDEGEGAGHAYHVRPRSSGVSRGGQGSVPGTRPDTLWDTPPVSGETADGTRADTLGTPSGHAPVSHPLRRGLGHGTGGIAEERPDLDADFEAVPVLDPRSVPVTDE